MFFEVELQRHVAVLARNLDCRDRVVSQRLIITRLLEELLREKVSKDRGYFVAVTGIKRIGKGRVVNNSGDDVIFPVVFKCRTFLPVRGDMLEGVVHNVTKSGVYLRCGPIQNMCLPYLRIPGYEYVPGENPVYFNFEKMLKIEKDSMVRLIVIGTLWHVQGRDFDVVVCMQSDSSRTRFLV